MSSRQRNIRNARAKVGWAHSELKWLGSEEAQAANARLRELVGALEGRVARSYCGTKLHLGELSPGCVSCGEGAWSCVFTTGRCTADCFFCPQDTARAPREARLATLGVRFGDASEYADFVDAFGFRGVGLSGGEPLLVRETVLAVVRELKRRRGSELYVWLYSNGRLADEEALGLLGEAGLDEVRFNVVHCGYDLSACERAARFIPTVTVEIPAVPEDSEALRECVLRMAEAGVRHLNLHQLLATSHNFRAFAQRGYTLVHHPSLPVLESEFAALELLQWAAEEGVGLPINYCCSAYKDRIQSQGRRAAATGLVRRPWEDVSGAGYLREVAVRGDGERIREVARRLGAGQWEVAEYGTELRLPLEAARATDLGDCTVTVRYCTARLREGEGAEGRTVTLGEGRRLGAAREAVAEFRDLSQAALEALGRIAVDGTGEGDAVRWFQTNRPLARAEDVGAMVRERRAIEEALEWERVEEGLPEVY